MKDVLGTTKERESARLRRAIGSARGSARTLVPSAWSDAIAARSDTASVLSLREQAGRMVFEDVRSSADTRAALRLSWLGVAYLAVALTSLAAIWLWRFVPFQDAPDWIVQGALFADWMQGRLAPAYVPLAGLAPNCISTLVIGVLALIVPPAAAGKLFLSACVLGHLAAGRLLLTRASQHSPLQWLPLLTVWNHPFINGNISYAFALPVFFVSAWYVLTRMRRVHWLGICAAATALYLCHAIVFACFVALLGGLAIARPTRALVRKLALGLAPSLLLGVWYLLARLHDPRRALVVTSAPKTVGAWLSLKFGTLAKFFGPLHAFQPFDEDLGGFVWPMVGLNTAFFALLVWLVVDGRRQARTRDVWLVRTALVLVALFFVAPKACAGIINPGERFLLPGLFLLAASARAARVSPWAQRALLAATLAQLSMIAVHGTQAAAHVDDFHTALTRHTPVNGRWAVLHTGDAGRSLGLPPHGASGWRALPRHDPLSRHALLLQRERGRPFSTFETGLFGYRGPVTMASSLNELSGLGPLDALVLVGEDGDNRALAERLAPRYTAQERGAGYLILEAHSPLPQSPAQPRAHGDPVEVLVGPT